MFDESIRVSERGPAPMNIAGSVVAQVACLAGLVLYPLVNTYEIDLGAWARHLVRLAPPPPPAPPPAPIQAAPQAAPRRFEAEFQAPSRIPDRVAFLSDSGALASPISAGPAPSGPAGGLGGSDIGGVLGMFPTSGPTMPPPMPIRVGGNVQNAKIVTRILPVYPVEAVEQGISGKVKLEAVIDTQGRVRDLQVIEGHPMLVPAALEAVSQWVYRPTRLNGAVVEVVTLVDVIFNLTIPDAKELKRLQREARRKARQQGR